jgi:hypothetical protein
MKSERAKVRDRSPTGDAATPSIKDRIHRTERGAIRHPRNAWISSGAWRRIEKQLILKCAILRRPEQLKDLPGSGRSANRVSLPSNITHCAGSRSLDRSTDIGRDRFRLPIRVSAT